MVSTAEQWFLLSMRLEFGSRDRVVASESMGTLACCMIFGEFLQCVMDGVAVFGPALGFCPFIADIPTTNLITLPAFSELSLGGPTSTRPPLDP